MLNYLETRDLNGARIEARRLGVLQRYFRDELKEKDNAVLGLGSFLAGIGLERYEEAQRILKAGLLANPQDTILLNNLTYYQALGGKIPEAAETFAKIQKTNCPGQVEVVLLATQGLLRYRQGFPEEGRALYLQAIEKANGESLFIHRIIAALNFAREELLSNSPEALTVKEKAVKEARNFFHPSITALIERLENTGVSKGRQAREMS